jgi:hypothetical protein
MLKAFFVSDLGNRAIGQSGNRAIGQSGNRAIGQSGNRAIGQLYTFSNILCQLTDSVKTHYKQFSHSIGKTPVMAFSYINTRSIE